MDRYIGVDGCKAGWFSACLVPEGGIDFNIFPSLEDLWVEYGDGKSLILVDIPIGLPSKERQNRKCDTEARRILGPKRRSSIFAPPCREALNASCYEEACEINMGITGRKISLQAWGIVPKIREMDKFLRQYSEAHHCIRESHPEVCFWAMNGGRSMMYPKKSKQGFAERSRLLKSLLPLSQSIVKTALRKHFKKDVAGDDVLDALILAATGFLAEANLCTLPEAPEKDAFGLTMQIVYCSVKLSPAGGCDRLSHIGEHT
ncbi:MAG: DUF429 domain-containing protein [Deltaproteobacteria bacterium]|nr:DUF429 domain-containing protein [Deltaproteobacteria bacterium]